ncbi:DUF229 domain containing, partial [Brachionus plicatilis]
FCSLISILVVKQYSNLTHDKHLKDNQHSIDFYQKHLWPRQSPEQELTCKLPRLNFEGHEHIEKYQECKLKEEFGFLKNSHWYFNKTVISKYKNFECSYRNINRNDDFDLVYSKYVKLKESQKIDHQVIEVNCLQKDKKKQVLYNNLHVQIVNRIHLRQKVQANNDKCKPLNILLLSYDSISRVSWFKRLPQTTEYLINQMNTTVLYGHNIIGDGTPACMIPVLTGKTEEELPSTLKSDPKGQYVDQVYPFIWNDLHKKGYMSFHMEDWPQVSAFTYRLRGFSNKTAHHYMRSYQLGLWKRVQNAYFTHKDDLCIGSVKRSKKSLDLVQEFIDMYKTKSNYAAIMHYIENSHDGNERANHLDQDLKNFLSHNFEAGNLNNTALFLYSDHGSRFGMDRWSNQGDLEERLPFVSLFLPQSFTKSRPDQFKNLQINSQQLTTPFDIHQTIRELSCTKESEKIKHIRAISLLDKIPVNRTCQSIGLSTHYCVCDQNWQFLDIKEKFSLHSAEYIVSYLNKVLSKAKDYCVPLRLKEISYVKKAKIGGEVYYKINLATEPNHARYEALVKFDQTEKKLLIKSTNSVSRLDAYGSQPKCLESVPPSKNLTVDLRKFCLCKPKRRLKV